MQLHPLYEMLLLDWQEYRLSYEGGRQYLNRYLFRHAKEREVDYVNRLRRAVYPNHMRAVIDTYAAHLFREPIPRGTKSKTLQEFWQNTDLFGGDANEFYEHVAQLVQRGGRCAVVVDRYDPDGGMAVTKAQERLAGRRPYAYAVDTEDILDWNVDRLGRLNWVVIREFQEDQRKWLEPHPGPEYQYRVWTDTEWILYKGVQVEENGQEITNYTEIDRGEHPCGEVPVAFAFWGHRLNVEPVADSAIKDLAPLNRRLANHVSLIDEQIYQHVFNILATPQSTYDVLEGVNWSVSGAIPYADDVRKPPFYLGPDVSQIESLRTEIEKTEHQIRVLSGLGRVNDENKSVQSGIALSYLTMDKDALLGKFGQRFERLENKVDQLALKWMGETGESTRQYPDEFDPQDVANELDEAIKFASLGISGAAAIENAIQAARARFSRLSADEFQKVEADLRQHLGSPSPTPAPSLRSVG